MKGAVGFERMAAKLRDPGRIESPIAELEMAGRLAGSGCRIEFEPEVDGKKPDLLCRSGESEFFVEVKTLGIARRAGQATQTLVDVLAACRPISPAGNIFRILAGAGLGEGRRRPEAEGRPGRLRQRPRGGLPAQSPEGVPSARRTA